MGLLADETALHFHLQKQHVQTETNRVPILSHRGRYCPSLGRETADRVTAKVHSKTENIVSFKCDVDLKTEGHFQESETTSWESGLTLLDPDVFSPLYLCSFSCSFNDATQTLQGHSTIF